MTISAPDAAPPDLSTAAWPWPPPGAVKLGSEAHKRLFCRTLLDTFDPYRPAVIDWPKLDPEAEARLTGLPIWDIAVQTESQAMRRVKAYADVVEDPLVKKALELNAFEEGRHKRVLSCLAQAYGVELQPEPPQRAPTDAEWSFLFTGFGECIDSFVAFGLFEAAKRTGFFPTALVDTFERVMAEEGRHILFFVNWVAWRRRTAPWWRRPWFELKVWAVWIALALDRLALVTGFNPGRASQPGGAAAAAGMEPARRRQYHRHSRRTFGGGRRSGRVGGRLPGGERPPPRQIRCAPCPAHLRAGVGAVRAQDVPGAAGAIRHALASRPHHLGGLLRMERSHPRVS